MTVQQAAKRSDPKDMRYTFDDFMSDLQLITSAERDQAEIIRMISRKMRILMANDTGFLTKPEMEEGERHYARHMVFVDRHRRFVVMSSVWRPGQGTPVHDHGTWGIMGILKGELRVTNYLRMDDRSKPGFAELREASGLVSTQGGVTYVLPPNEEIHKVENVSEENAYGLHVYGKDIVECNMYDLTRKSYRPYSLEYEGASPADTR